MSGKRWNRCVAAWLVGSVTLAAAAQASAQITSAASYTPPDDNQQIKVGAVIYTDYTYTQEPKTKDADGNAINPSAFNVTRSYINITGNLSHVVSFRITPDVTRDTDANSALTGNLVFRLKYAFAQLNMDDWTGAWKGTWVRVGIQQTPYVDYAESIYRYRFQGTTFTEREQIGGNLTSSDAGVSFHTGFPSNYGEFHVGFYNGEGYSKTEANDQKAAQARFTVRPFATGPMMARGFRLTAFYDADHYVKSAERKRLVIAPTYEGRWFNAGYEYLDGKDQTSIATTDVESKGWSFWATPFFHEKGNGPELLLRYDAFKPTVSVASQQRKRTIAGFAYWFPHPGGAATAALMLDFEQVKFDGFAATPANATQQRYALHALINF